MQALRYHGAKDIRLEDVDEPQVTPGTVKVEVDWCGICGTDVHEYLAGPIIIPTASNPHPLTGGSLPIVMGHECAGEIVEFGEGVSGLPVGEKVAIEPLFYCRECSACLAGAYNLCPKFGAIGLSGGGGAYARYLVVPAYMIHPLPDAVSTEAGALAEPITVGWHAMMRAGFRAGETALVVGAGPIGLGALLSLQAAGAHFVAVSERETGTRTDLARTFGADAVLDASEDEVVERIKELNGGNGVDAVIETSGAQAGMDTALSAVRRGGRVVSVAVWETPPQIDCNKLLADETSLLGSQAYVHEYPAVLKAIADGRIRNVEKMVTKRLALTDIVAGGFEELVENKRDHVKILVHP